MWEHHFSSLFFDVLSLSISISLSLSLSFFCSGITAVRIMILSEIFSSCANERRWSHFPEHEKRVIGVEKKWMRFIKFSC